MFASNEILWFEQVNGLPTSTDSLMVPADASALISRSLTDVPRSVVHGLVVHVVEVLLLSLNGLEVAPVSPVLEAVRV